jgi:acyl carrier protein
MDAEVFNEEKVLTKVIDIISEIAMVEASEIEPASSLVDDLGMESIDFLDLTFRIEQTFNIEIPRMNPIQRISDLIGPDVFIQDDRLTEEGVRLLGIIFPKADPSKIFVGLPVDNIPSLITVQTYVYVVKRGLQIANWMPDECDKCGKAEFKTLDKGELEFPNDIVPLGPVYMCKACEEILMPPSFDKEICQKLGIDIEQLELEPTG